MIDELYKLYEILENSLDSNGLPKMNSSQFIEVREKYGRKKFRTALADYIRENKPPYPLPEIDYRKRLESFYKLQRADW